MTCLKSLAIAVALAATVGSSLAQSTFRLNTSVTDIHDYQNVPYDMGTVSGQILERWARDGSTADASLVLDTDPRYAVVSPYIGLNPNGQWTLFLSDVEIGQEATLEKLGLVISAVPEPATGTFLLLGVLTLGLSRSRTRPCR
jgi:hypothetical protein